MSWAITSGYTPIPWTPANISTALWLDAADASTITTVSGGVSEWRDKSGYGRHATQVTAGNRPTLASNAITFNAALSTRLLCPLSATKDIENVFVVANASSSNILPQTLIGASSNGGRQYRLLQTFAQLNAQAQAALSSSSPVNAPKDGLAIFNLNYQTRALTSTHYLNGQLASSTTQGNQLSGTTTSSIGATASGAEGLTGTISEIIILEVSASTTLRQQIEGYLAHKWGLTANLPSDHPYKSTPP